MMAASPAADAVDALAQAMLITGYGAERGRPASGAPVLADRMIRQLLSSGFDVSRVADRTVTDDYLESGLGRYMPGSPIVTPTAALAMAMLLTNYAEVLDPFIARLKADVLIRGLLSLGYKVVKAGGSVSAEAAH